MSCTRAAEIDLAAFRTEPGRAEFADFARHYPTCADCAREVAVWSRLEAALRAAGADAAGEAHPAEERLLAFQDAPDSLDAAQRRAVEVHLAGCARCRNELAVLRRFDLAALAGPRAADAATARAGGASRGERLRAGLTRLAEAVFGVPRPALAFALLLALLAPAAWLSWRLATGAAGDAAPAVARRDLPGPEPLDAPEPRAEEPEPQGVIARRQEVPTAPSEEEAAAEPAPAPEGELAVAPAGEPLVEVAVEPGPEPPSGGQASRGPEVLVEVAVEPGPEPPSGGQASRGPEVEVAEAPPAPAAEPFRIAARLPAELPAYTPDASLFGGALESVRVASAVRAGTGDLPRIRALAPEHTGATREASPTLYWRLDAPSEVPVELTLVAEDAAEPLLELRVDSPRAGLHPLRLAERGVELEPGRPYRWFASLVPDDTRRDRDVVSGGGILRAPPDAELARRLEQAPPERRVHLLAGAGYWYDAFDTVERWLDAEPGAPRLVAYRDALLRQAGLVD